MATRQVKKTVTTRTHKSGESSNSTSSRGSISRITRLQEKDELTGLNDRLAAYIDHIRSLENENERLTVKITSFEETTKREVDSIKHLYEKELAAARKLVDEVSKENAQLSVSVGTYKSEAEEWMRKYSKKDRELSALTKKYNDLQSLIGDLEAQLKTANKEKERWQTEYGRVSSEVGNLERQLAAARKQLEDETLMKVDLENKIQSLKEELAFKSQLHQTQLNETRTRMEYSMEEVDSHKEKDYEHRLAEALADFRQQHEEEMAVYREEVETLYEAKIRGMERELSQQGGHDEHARMEISSYKSRISELQSQLAKLAKQNSTLEARVSGLEADLAAERDQSRALCEMKEREITHLREQIDELMSEYQALLEIKVSLDLEIAAYRKLIEGEEERLNLSTSQSEIKVTPGRKRKRGDDSSYIQESSSNRGFSTTSRSTGGVEILEVCQEGKFIKFLNNTNAEMHLGGWKVVHKADGGETDYKFHNSVKLGAGEVATVWSSDAGATHDAHTHNFVMKGRSWVTGGAMSTTLMDKSGAEQALCEMNRTIEKVTMRGSRRYGSEEIFHQTGDPANQSSCSIM